MVDLTAAIKDNLDDVNVIKGAQFNVDSSNNSDNISSKSIEIDNEAMKKFGAWIDTEDLRKKEVVSNILDTKELADFDDYQIFKDTNKNFNL